LNEGLIFYQASLSNFFKTKKPQKNEISLFVLPFLFFFKYRLILFFFVFKIRNCFHSFLKNYAARAQPPPTKKKKI